MCGRKREIHAYERMKIEIVKKKVGGGGIKASHDAFNYCNPPVVECKHTCDQEMRQYYAGLFCGCLEFVK